MICQESTNVHVCLHVFWNSGSNHQNVDHVQKKKTGNFQPISKGFLSYTGVAV